MSAWLLEPWKGMLRKSVTERWGKRGGKMSVSDDSEVVIRAWG
jgi:hypothetical protein